MKADSTPKCMRPEGQVDGGRPALACMEELLPCALSEIPDVILGNAILEVGVDPTEGELLPFGTAAALEGIVCKLSIVAVVVEYADVVLLGNVFKGLFGLHGLLRGKLGHEVDILEP
jgi:hypothetical protein